MSVNIPNWFGPTFDGLVRMALQQGGSVLSNYVESGPHTGDSASPVENVGQVEMQEANERYAPIGRVDSDLDRRWCTPGDYDLPQYIDTLDRLRTVVSDPQSAYVKNAVMAAGRRIDRNILQSFRGTAKTGRKGDVSTSFTSGNNIGVSVGGTNSRINLTKIRNVRKLMRKNFINFDVEQPYIGLTADDEDALLNDPQITSLDYTDRPVLVDGKLRRILGMEAVFCELIESELASTNKVYLPVWTKAGMYHGTWMEPTTTITVDTQKKRHPIQIYTLMSGGATRLDEKRVYSIESYRS